MRHIQLSCKNHPTMFWSAKEIAVKDNPKVGEPAEYNGTRNIFFQNEGAECPCPASDLLISFVPKDVV